MANPRIYGLYAITPDLQEFDLYSDHTRSILAQGAQVLQYRNKCATPAQKLEQAGILRLWCSQSGSLFIVNDDINLALAVNADGVHLGSKDVSLTDARRKLGPHKLIGISCYNLIDRAHEAEAKGADYVAFGSFFPSQTKPAAQPAPLSLLTTARIKLKIPIVAIGGITPQNGKKLVEAGANALAVLHALYSSPDPATSARSFSELFNLESLPT